MSTKKYNLTFLQRVELIFLWPIWFLYPYPTRKSWHNVKKGMEKHEHNYIIPEEEIYKGRVLKYLKCEHEGCNVVDPID